MLYGLFLTFITVTPEISAQEYYNRRQALADSLPAKSVLLIPSATLKYRNGPVFHQFHQDTNFFYLTGFDEPDSVAIIGMCELCSKNERSNDFR
jgi:intermediate cleaving peptidase 55